MTFHWQKRSWTYQNWSHKLNWVYNYVPCLGSFPSLIPPPLFFFFFLTNWKEEPGGVLLGFLNLNQVTKEKTFLAKDNSWPVFLLLQMAFFKTKGKLWRIALVDEACSWQVGWKSVKTTGRNCIKDNPLEVIQIPIFMPKVSNFLTIKPFVKWIKCRI